MDFLDEPLNLTMKKIPLDVNQNIKTLNTDMINRDAKKNDNRVQDGCLDLSKANNKQVNDEDTKNKRYFYENMKNQQYRSNIFDDVYKHSYIYENLCNTYPENILSAFADNKFLASWYASSIMNASAYLNLARSDDTFLNKQNKNVNTVLNNSADKKPANRDPNARFELIKNETKEHRFCNP